jgi:hypothetical protein
MRKRFNWRIPKFFRPLFLKWLTRDSNLVRHAQRELDLAGLFDKDSDYGGMLGEAVMRMIREFSDEGHSGFSARMAADLFSKLARYEPIRPLTGDPQEWVDHGHIYQNARCSHVFKEYDGQAYDLQGRIFREPSGACYQNSDSRVPITFPYWPKTEYVDVPASP